MLVEANNLRKTISSLLRHSLFGSHEARIKSLSELIEGLLCSVQGGLSGMGRGRSLILENQNFRSQLQRAFRLINNKYLDPWEVGKGLYDQMTQGSNSVMIAVDWTQINYMMILEASLVVDGRGIPLYSICVWKDELKGRQRAIELAMEYALSAMRNEGQTLYVTVDRGFAALDYMGPSQLYPYMHRINRLKKDMILQWDDLKAPLQEWPLEEGEVVEIDKAILGRKKHVYCGVVLAHFKEACYLACHPDDVAVAVEYYQTRVWVEEMNRDLKTHFRLGILYFHKQVRMERIWATLGIALAIAYSGARKKKGREDHYSRRYKDGRKDLSWLSASRYIYQFQRMDASILPIAA